MAISGLPDGLLSVVKIGNGFIVIFAPGRDLSASYVQPEYILYCEKETDIGPTIMAHQAAVKLSYGQAQAEFDLETSAKGVSGFSVRGTLAAAQGLPTTLSHQQINKRKAP